MVNVVANSVVPKFTFITGNSYGAGNYAMCGKAYDPRLIMAWPSAQIAVMGGKQASETLLSIRLGAAERSGEQMPDGERETLLREIQQRYEAELDPLFAAARLWIDDIIDPTTTRSVIDRGISLAAHNPEIPPFNPGVIQV
jgi:acetyl-CoA carboxylase carboxyltransferase component